MKHTMIFAAALTFLGIARPANTAEITLTRASRQVSQIEALEGAPEDGMVHDFYVTTSADILVLLANIDAPLYQHSYGSDTSAPDSQFVEMFSALGADSFLTTPGSTFTLGGGFSGTGPEKVWADFSNDGPVKGFLFGRLTTSQSGLFTGSFYLRGADSYAELPFSLTLPGLSGERREELSVQAAEFELPHYEPPEPSSPTDEETTAREPRHMKPSRVAELTSWMLNLPELPPPPTSEILAFKESLLAFKESRQQNLPQPRRIAGTVAAIPEPTARMLCAVALPFLVRRRSA